MSSSRLIASTTLLLILISTLLAQPTEAQGGTVRGRVYARDYLGNFVPVGFASIMVKGDAFETIIRTDTDGYYVAYLPAGTYVMTGVLSTVTLDYTQSKTVAVWYGSDTTINFYLEPAVAEFPLISVTISIGGLPSQYSVESRIDNSLQGLIAGGETKQFRVKAGVSHTFSVQSYLEVSKGERYYCQSDSWILGGSAGAAREAGAAHTFSYTTQYFLSVATPHGDAGGNAGWYAKDHSVSLNTPRTVEVSQGVRDVFDGWVVSDSESKDYSLNIILRSPTEAKANYHKEYYLQLVSPYGKPSGSGWYREGSTAVISAERDLPLPGLMGALGAKNVFKGWSGDKTASSNTADVLMDSPKTVAANWTADYATPYLIILLVTVLIITIAVLAQKKTISGPRRTGDQD